MKRCVFLILLTIFCPGGCPVYNFDLRTVELPKDLTNDFQLEADLTSQINQDLQRVHMGGVSEEESKYDNMKTNSNSQSDTALEEVNFERKNIDDKLLRSPSETELDESKGIENFVGTNLFDGNRKKCFSTEDMALLTTRKDFESLIPKDLPQCLLSDEMVHVLMQYFNSGNKIIQRMSDECSKRLTEKAFYDTMGGYLKSYIVPVTKLSFYAGKVNLKTVESVVMLYQQCKSYLNTNGNGWRAPIPDLQNELKSVQITPLRIKEDTGEADEVSWCAQLDLSSVNNDAEDEQMIVSLPRLDPEDSDGYLTNIWLPFRRKRTFNLRSCNAAFIVVRFYETVTHCYNFQKMCQETYNHRFREWIMEFIQMHLADEQFYPGLGAILRIYENLRRGKKAIKFKHLQNDDSENEMTDESNQTDQNESNETNEEESNKETDSSNEEEDVEGDEESLKTRQFYDIEKAAKKMQSKNRNPFNSHLRTRDSDTTNDPCITSTTTTTTLKPNCLPSTKQHTKLKSKSKSKTKSKSKSKSKSKFKIKNYFSWLKMPQLNISKEQQKVYLKYAAYAIALILFLLLLILCCGICGKKGKKGLCAKLCCKFKRKKSPDEHVVLKSDSKSVMPSKSPQGTSSTSSSLTCHPQSKCLPCTLKGGRKSDAAVIETTSMDYTSSEPEGRGRGKTRKGKHRVVTINEKKNSPRKRKLKKDVSLSESTIDKCFSKIGFRRNSGTDASVKK